MALEALKRTLGLDAGDTARQMRPPVPADQQFKRPGEQGIDQRIPSARDELPVGADSLSGRRRTIGTRDTDNDRFGDAIGLNLSAEAREFMEAGGTAAALEKTRALTPLQLASTESGKMQDFVDGFFHGATGETVQTYAGQVHDMIMQMEGAIQDLRLDMAAMQRLEQAGGNVATLISPTGERLRVTSQYINGDNMALSLTYMSREMGVLSLDMHRHIKIVPAPDGQQQPVPQMTVRESLREARGDDLAEPMTRSLTVDF